MGNHVYQFPTFIYEYGNAFHHMSMMRTVDVDEEGDFIPGTGPRKFRFQLHEFLDGWVFYPIQAYIKERYGYDSRLGGVLRAILGFFWGLNCGFPLRDVVLYTAWALHGCKPVKVFTLEVIK